MLLKPMPIRVRCVWPMLVQLLMGWQRRLWIHGGFLLCLCGVYGGIVHANNEAQPIPLAWNAPHALDLKHLRFKPLVNKTLDAIGMQVLGSDDSKEGPRAFAEKRKPAFKAK